MNSFINILATTFESFGVNNGMKAAQQLLESKHYTEWKWRQLCYDRMVFEVDAAVIELLPNAADAKREEKVYLAAVTEGLSFMFPRTQFIWVPTGQYISVQCYDENNYIIIKEVAAIVVKEKVPTLSRDVNHESLDNFAYDDPNYYYANSICVDGIQLTYDEAFELGAEDKNWVAAILHYYGYQHFTELLRFVCKYGVDKLYDANTGYWVNGRPVIAGFSVDPVLATRYQEAV